MRLKELRLKKGVTQNEVAIVMAKSTHPKRDETLAEYYFRTNRHLLGKIKILEYDPISNDMRLIGQN